MKQTVIGLFNTSSQARKAIEHLIDKGFDDNDIDFLDGSTYNSSGTDTTDRITKNEPNRNTDFNLDDRSEHESKITRFFKNLFGDNDKESTERYTAAAARGNSVVTVYTDTDDEAQEAAHILDNNGAINADDSDDTSRETGDAVVEENRFDNREDNSDNIDFRDRTREDYNGRDLRNEGNNPNYDTAAEVRQDYETGDNPDINTSDTRLRNDVADNTAVDVRNAANTAVNNNDVTDSDVTGNTNRNNLEKDDEANRTSLPIIEETVQIGKRTIETGGVRLKSRIVERPVEENLRLREERVFMNRNKVNRAATEADLATFKEGAIELVEHTEVPVINKEARVVEEISLGKEVNERNETVRDTVRKTEVEVEQLKGENRTETDRNNNNIRRDN